MTKYHKVEVKDNMKVAKEEQTPTEKPKIKPVIGYVPKEKQPGLTKRLFKGLAGPEGIKGIIGNVARDIVMPTIKVLIVDSLTSAIRMTFLGEDTPVRSSWNSWSSSPKYATHTEYQKQFKGTQEMVTLSGGILKEYTIKSREDAKTVVRSMIEHADQFGFVSVAEYYEFIGAKPIIHTHYNWGWTIDQIVKATVLPGYNGGYVIQFPPLQPLD